MRMCITYMTCSSRPVIGQLQTTQMQSHICSEFDYNHLIKYVVCRFSGFICLVGQRADSYKFSWTHCTWIVIDLARWTEGAPTRMYDFLYPLIQPFQCLHVNDRPIHIVVLIWSFLTQSCSHTLRRLVLSTLVCWYGLSSLRAALIH